MTMIELTKGKTAQIDPCDADLQGFRWYASKMGSGFYAVRKAPRSEGHGTIRLAWVIAERMGLETGRTRRIDHANGNTLDNRRANLRSVTPTENARNVAEPPTHNTSGHMGVTFDKSRNKWMAHIKIGGAFKNLGRFDSMGPAIAARLSAEREQWGVQPRRALAHEG